MVQTMATTRTAPTRTSKHAWIMTLVVGLVASMFVVIAIRAHGDISGLIGVGPASPAHPQVVADMPDAVEFTHTGLDGALFYAIARHPTDVASASRYLDYPTYRLRRILLPFTAGLLVPSGGAPLIATMAAISILGTMLGAWWSTKFPGATDWLPLMAVINPGVILALTLTLSDALATGLVLAAFGSMFSRKTALAVVFLTLACLTRETSAIAALCLATWPGLKPRHRALVGLVPLVPIGAWSWYVAQTLGEPLFAQHPGGTVTLPLMGWARADFGGADLIVALLGVVLMGAALAKGRRVVLPVRLYLAVTLAMVVCASPIIAETWFGTGRVMSVGFPLAIWVLSRRGRAPKAHRAPEPSTGDPSSPQIPAGQRPRGRRSYKTTTMLPWKSHRPTCTYSRSSGRLASVSMFREISSPICACTIHTRSK